MTVSLGSRLFRPWLIALALVFTTAGVAFADDATLTIVSGENRHVFNVEVVDTDETRARGLMFRQSLDPDAGMLFDFVDERPVSFWMQNTLIALDMLFVKADGEIVRIHENAIPLDTTAIPSGEPVRFVLEIPGGRSAELGLAVGDRLDHPRIEGQ